MKKRRLGRWLFESEWDWKSFGFGFEYDRIYPKEFLILLGFYGIAIKRTKK